MPLVRFGLRVFDFRLLSAYRLRFDSIRLCFVDTIFFPGFSGTNDGIPIPGQSTPTVPQTQQR